MAQYIVCIRNRSGGRTIHLGPYERERVAQQHADELTRDIQSRGAERVLSATVEQLRSAVMEFWDVRHAMWHHLDVTGYPPPATDASKLVRHAYE